MKPHSLQLTFIAMLIATRLFARNQAADGKYQTRLTANRQFLATGVAEECSSPKVLLSTVKNSLRKADKHLLEGAEIADCKENDGLGSSKNFTFKLSFGSFICPEIFSVLHNPDGAKSNQYSANDLSKKLKSCSDEHRKGGKTSLQNGDNQLSDLDSSLDKEEDQRLPNCDKRDDVYTLIIKKALEEHLVFPKNLELIYCRYFFMGTTAYYYDLFRLNTRTCSVHLDVAIDKDGLHISSDSAREQFIKDVKDCIAIAEQYPQVSAEI